MTDFIFENFENDDNTVLVRLQKGNVILRNLDKIEDYSSNIGRFNTNNITKIISDFDNYSDEFYLESTIDIGSKITPSNNIISLEVVTAEEAEINDLDFVRDKNVYYANGGLGGEYSYYAPLDSKKLYYYRLL